MQCHTSIPKWQSVTAFDILPWAAKKSTVLTFLPDLILGSNSLSIIIKSTPSFSFGGGKKATRAYVMLLNLLNKSGGWPPMNEEKFFAAFTFLFTQRTVREWHPKTKPLLFSSLPLAQILWSWLDLFKILNECNTCSLKMYRLMLWEYALILFREMKNWSNFCS